MDQMVKQYLITALWSSGDGEIEHLDSQFGIEDISEESVAKATADCQAFCKKAGVLLDGLDLSTVGHDFWLTRNHHGAGFWDGDYSKSVGEKLTKLSHEFGEIHPYVGDDGKVYIE